MSTRDEKMSSPRGFAAGGIGAIGREIDADLARGLAVCVGDIDRDEVAIVGSLGLGKKKESGFHANLDAKGGLRTLRYMLNERRARFAWGTYLFAYAIFSEYIPLAKKRTSVVILTKRRLLAK